MASTARTTMAITLARKIKLERLAIEASQKVGKSIKWTDISNYLIDNYAKDAMHDLVHKEDHQENQDIKKKNR